MVGLRHQFPVWRGGVVTPPLFSLYRGRFAFGIYPPRVWGFGWHWRKRDCCRFWLTFGPVDFLWVW